MKYYKNNPIILLGFDGGLKGNTNKFVKDINIRFFLPLAKIS